jgi:hypothetical protein
MRRASPRRLQKTLPRSWGSRTSHTQPAAARLFTPTADEAEKLRAGRREVDGDPPLAGSGCRRVRHRSQAWHEPPHRLPLQGPHRAALVRPASPQGKRPRSVVTHSDVGSRAAATGTSSFARSESKATPTASPTWEPGRRAQAIRWMDARFRAARGQQHPRSAPQICFQSTTNQALPSRHSSPLPTGTNYRYSSTHSS